MLQLPQYVIKKNGNRARFNAEKLRRSVIQTFRHANVENLHQIGAVLTDLFHELSRAGKETVDVSVIRKETTAVLNRYKLHAVADAYDLTFLHLKHVHIAKVMKRDGREADFHPYKIWNAIRKALRDARFDTPSEAQTITTEVIAELEAKHAAQKDSLSTAEIRRAVEQALVRHNLSQAASAYVRHRYL